MIGRAVAALTLVLLCGGCGGDGEKPATATAPQRSAADLYQALEERDATVAGPAAADAEARLRRDRARARRRLGSRPDFKIPPAAIAGKDADEVWATVIDRITFEVDTPYEPDPRFARLSAGQKALYILRLADAEILNGGFSQFYFNSTGYFAADLPSAARAVGALEHARVATSANRLLAGDDTSVPRQAVQREALLDDVFGAALSRLDGRWAAVDGPTLAQRAATYVRAHPGEFVAARP